jgi:Tfp pilus assembly protein PilN
LFHLRENRLELRRRSGEDLKVDGSWINKTGLIAEGLASQPYIHLDIRTPFGETVGESQVEETLAESLGFRKDRYRLGGWHIQFVEDTNLGSNHRVFVDLIDMSSGNPGLPGMDSGMSLEVAVEALGEMLAAESGEQNFQLLYGGDHFCYSLLFLNGSPFHVLRVGDGSGPKAAAKLRRHREFAPGVGRNGLLKTFLTEGDPLREQAVIAELQPEPFKLASMAGRKDSNSWLLHLGLAHAARQRDFTAHNRVAADQRRANDSIRTRFRLILAMVATALFCALLAGTFALAIRCSQTELQSLKAQAAVFQTQVDSIRTLRIEKTRLEAAVADLRPLWHPPVDWSAVLGAISAALPKEAGIDGLSVNRQADGSLELSFRAWVRDWNQVQNIQKQLIAGKRFSEISLSEQRKDLGTGVVIFHVTGKLERP